MRHLQLALFFKHLSKSNQIIQMEGTSFAL